MVREAATLAAYLTDLFKREAPLIAAQVSSEYVRATKAKGKSKADKILDSLNLDRWVSIVDRVEKPLQQTFTEGGTNALAELKMDTSDMFDVVNEDALAFAKERGAELVGMMWVDDDLVGNPDPSWAITETTRDGIRELVQQAIEEGWSEEELAQRIKDDWLFSEGRAEVIARTELARANVEGNLSAWVRSGVVNGKEWIVSDDHDTDDECDGNEEEGVIPVEELFSSGDLGPPAHPNCSCVIVAAVGDEDN